MPARYQYFAILGLCLLGTAVLEFGFDARVWRRPARLAKSLIAPYLLFLFFTEFAIFRRIWGYSDQFIIGTKLPRRLPIEEILFFVVVPVCALLVYETAFAVFSGRVSFPGFRGTPPSPFLKGSTAVGRMDGGASRTVVSWKVLVAGAVFGVVGLVAVFAVSVLDSTDVPEYPIYAVALLGGVVILEQFLWRTEIFRMRAYWTTVGIFAVAQVLVNGWMTKLSAPIIRYSVDESLGWRPIWDIPIEDLGCGFALLTFVMMSWKRSGQTA